MRMAKRTVVAITVGLLFVSLSFGDAIVAGFNSTSDGRNDDGTYTTGGCNNPADGGTCAGSLVPIGFSGNFFGTTFDSLYINTNGNVTLDSPLSAPNPFPLVDGFNQIIAPFFADVDTRNPASGVVSFGAGSFDGFTAFGVNWPNVGYFNQEASPLDTFQLLLVSRPDQGPGAFEIVFNYGSIGWESGDSDFGTGGLGGNSARVGFSDGTGNPDNSFELPGSGVPGSLIDGGPQALISHSLNSDVSGRYIFDFQNGVPVTVPEPGSFGLLLSALLLLVCRAFRVQAWFRR